MFSIWNLDSLPARDFARIALIESLQATYDFDFFGVCDSMLTGHISNDDILISYCGRNYGQQERDLYLLSCSHQNRTIKDFEDYIKSFEKIYEIIHSKQSQNTYRRALEKHLENKTTWFYLNKQAAFADKIAICGESDESPLGPIKIVLTSTNIERIIDWLIHDE